VAAGAPVDHLYDEIEDDLSLDLLEVRDVQVYAHLYRDLLHDALCCSI